jgi:hypothetical protein
MDGASQRLPSAPGLAKRKRKRGCTTGLCNACAEGRDVRFNFAIELIDLPLRFLDAVAVQQHDRRRNRRMKKVDRKMQSIRFNPYSE